MDSLPDRWRKLFLDQIPGQRFHVEFPATDDDDDVRALVHNADALLTRRRHIDARLMAAAGQRLRFIQVHGRLPDRVDLHSASAAGIPVAVMPSKGAIAVAEHAIALMLALTRRIVAGHLGVTKAAYRTRQLEPAPTSETVFAFNWLGYPNVVELNGKTLGIVGFGEIGQEVARRARAFDMRVLYYSRTPLPARVERDLGVDRVALDALLQEADVVTLHVPHTSETARMLNAQTLALMKRTAFLINTARGGLIDEVALVAHLRAGRLAGAGLDVFNDEPLPADHPFVTLEEVVLSPHVGGGSGGGQRLHARESLENIDRALSGQSPQHLVRLPEDRQGGNAPAQPTVGVSRT